MSFAPPAGLNDSQRLQDHNQEVEMEDADYQPPPPPDSIPVKATGDDAYTRRLQMSQQQPPPPPPISHPPHPPPAPSVQPTPQIPSKPPASVFQPASATISRAPVRYTLPPAPEDIPATEEELEAVFATEEPVQEEEGNAPRSLRPGQKGFAERLMAKYGWTKGSGLGATGSGIVKPLQVKVEKQKKKPDSEGGGFATPGGRGKIISSKKKNEEEGKFGPMSEVIVLYGMLDGMDLNNELENSQGGGLMQEIGEECNEKVCFSNLNLTCSQSGMLTLAQSMVVWSVFLFIEKAVDLSQSL
jgi:splicing factor 45